MTRWALALAVWCLALLTLAVLKAEHEPANGGLPLVKVGMPLEGRIVIPWTLNTRCAVTSRNLPNRDPERTVS